MTAQTPSEREPRAVTILDLVFLIAGFACGLVLHRSSVIGPSEFYILPSGRGPFHSLMDVYIVGWLWAFACGLAFAAVGRRLCYGGSVRPAEWLALSLAIVLVNFAFPAFRPERAGSMGQEIAWVDWSADGKPVGFFLWNPERAERPGALVAVAIRMTAAATLFVAVAWILRTKIPRRWVVIPAIAIALLIILGPMRLAEATSTEITSSRGYPGTPPTSPDAVWSRTGLALYLDARTWGGYTPRALWLVTVAVATWTSLVRRRREWLWSEWAAFAVGGLLALCWIYDEFYSRPAIDRSTRVFGLALWLLVLAVPGLLIAQRFRPAVATNMGGLNGLPLHDTHTARANA